MSENRFINGGTGILDKIANHTITTILARLMMGAGIPLIIWLSYDALDDIKKTNIEVRLLSLQVKHNAKAAEERAKQNEQWLLYLRERMDRR